jgi:sugar phosphate isomerase/epimerase
MTVYVSTTFASLHSSVTAVLTALAERGITNIELGSIHCYEADLEAKLHRLNMNYLVHNYFPPPQEEFISNIASLSPAIRTRSLQHALESISFCRKIGAKLYTFHPGFITDPQGESTSSENYDFRFAGLLLDTAFEQLYEAGFQRFLEGVQVLVDHARQKGVRLAVESQGSVAQRNQLFLQQPAEFERLMTLFSPQELGISLNLGHLNLAAQAFGFDQFELVDQIAGYIVALEISHNEGQKDEHGPLVAGAWYWEVVRDPRLRTAFKIFEGRDLSVETAWNMVKWLEQAVVE